MSCNSGNLGDGSVDVSVFSASGITTYNHDGAHAVEDLPLITFTFQRYFTITNAEKKLLAFPKAKA